MLWKCSDSYIKKEPVDVRRSDMLNFTFCSDDLLSANEFCFQDIESDSSIINPDDTEEVIRKE